MADPPIHLYFPLQQRLENDKSSWNARWYHTKLLLIWFFIQSVDDIFNNTLKFWGWGLASLNGIQNKCNCFKRNLGNNNTNFFKLIFGYCLHACKIPLLYLIQSRLLFCSFSACLHFLWFAIKVKVGDLCNKVMIIYIQFSVLYSENGCFFFTSALHH